MTCSCRTFYAGSQDLMKILALIFSAFVSFTYKVFYVYLELTYTFVVSLLTTDIIVAQGYIANQTSGIFIAECDCLTANVMTIQFGNFSASSATPQAGYYEFQIVRSEGPLPTNAA